MIPSQALHIASRYVITTLTNGSIAYVASGFAMFASKVYLFAILLALAHSVIDAAPVATTAMLIFGISIFASTIYIFAITVKQEPYQEQENRVSNSIIAELCDDVGPSANVTSLTERRRLVHRGYHGISTSTAAKHWPLASSRKIVQNAARRVQ